MFSIFKKKSAPTPTPIIAPPVASNYKTKDFDQSLTRLLQNSKFLYRDTNLSPEIRAQYKKNLFFRESTFCDVTHKFGGPAANTRFLVISASPRDISGLSEHPEWGLCIFPSNELFKVIDLHLLGAFLQVTLLHIPKGFEAYFRSPDASHFEALIVPQTRGDFQEACSMPPLAELTGEEWLARTAHPLGCNNEELLLGE
ncbi:MAG: hypothetical protein V4805_06995 [Pseudomonadota bacterium]